MSTEEFNFSRHSVSVRQLMTGQVNAPCRANLHKWGTCDCDQRQTVNHIVGACALTKFDGGLNLGVLLHEADDDAVTRLESTATAALAK